MKKAAVLWNKDRTGYVVTKHVEGVTISQLPDEESWVVRGWYDKKEYFLFGCFSNMREATEFAVDLQKELEREVSNMATASEAIAVVAEWVDGLRYPSEALVALKQLLEMVISHVQENEATLDA